ncbi:N-acetylneuraminate synthase [Candidatus Parcubacteria bacterium]|nr:MAG: N-acetylneuraminate synthase [Candidatus Parcubacteria bacterium]
MNGDVLQIGKKVVGDGEPVFIIAEIGINHNGSLETTRKMIDVAVNSGCDAVKFQKRTIDIVYSEEELNKPRAVPADIIVSAIGRKVLRDDDVKRLTDSNLQNTTNGDLKRALELTLMEYQEIDDYCRKKDILWFASPWDEKSVDFLERFDPPCYKIASASLTDDELLRYIRNKGRPIILSTGMSDMEMIKHAIEILGKKDLIIMHCTSVYQQTEEGDHGLGMINLEGIRTLKKEFDVPVGFSSHDTGIMPTYASLAFGACAIEKHLTLYRAMWGSDQAASIEPDNLRRLCRAAREFSLVRGDGIIKIYPEEIPIMKKLRRKV